MKLIPLPVLDFLQRERLQLDTILVAHRPGEPDNLKLIHYSKRGEEQLAPKLPTSTSR